MKAAFSKLTVFFSATLLAASLHAEPSSWRYEAGASAGKLIPIMIEGGIGYKSAILRVSGFGAHKADNDYWCGFRGSLDWTFLRALPFNVDLGISGGYEFAEAPNKMHQAFNDANGGLFLFPYNYKEMLDVSAEIRVTVFGIFTQIDLPIHKFMDHDSPDYLWRAGYSIRF